MYLILSRQYILNHLTILTKLGMVVYYYEVRVMQKKWFTIYNVKIKRARAFQNMPISSISSKLLVHLQPNLV